MDENAQKPIIFFDGGCNLCNKAVQFVIKRDEKKRFRFSNINSVKAKELLSAHKEKIDTNEETIYLLENGNLYKKSEAVIKIGRELSFPWNILSPLGFIAPKFIRDHIYDFVAKNRSNWFSKTNICFAETEENKHLFIN